MPEDRNDIIHVQVSRSEAPQNEPSVAVSAGDPRLVVVTGNDFSHEENRSAVWRSTNGGRSFSRGRLLRRPEGFDRTSDPVVEFAAGDQLLVAAIAVVRDPSLQRFVRDGTVVVWPSDDAGRTFDDPVIVARGRGTDLFRDKPSLAADQSAGSPYEGRAYLSHSVFRNDFATADIAIQRSDDGGRSWSEPVTLTDRGETGQGSSVAVGRQGQVYLSWIDHESRRRGRVRFSRSDDGGASFGPIITVADIRPLLLCREGRANECLPVPGWRFRTGTFSFLGADRSGGPADGTLYAVWPEFRYGQAAIWLSRSDDEGVTWSEPRRVSGGDAIFPNITVSPETGEVYVVYVGNEQSPSPGTLMDVYVAEAPPGGMRFERRRVSSESFDPNADPFFGEPSHFIGDYIGISPLLDGGFITVWTDTRTGSQDIFAGIAHGDRNR